MKTLTNEQKEIPKKKLSKYQWLLELIVSGIGALVAVLVYIPLTFVYIFIFEYVGDYFHLNLCVADDLDDLIPLTVCILPFAGLGYLGGLVGVVLASNRYNRFGLLIGAVSGGLVASLIAAWMVAYLICGSP